MQQPKPNNSSADGPAETQTKVQANIQTFLEKMKNKSNSNPKPAADGSGGNKPGEGPMGSEKNDGGGVILKDGTDRGNESVKDKNEQNNKGQKDGKEKTIKVFNWEEIPFELASIQKAEGKLPVPGTALFGLFSWIVNEYNVEVGCYASCAPGNNVKSPCKSAKMVVSSASNGSGMQCRSVCCGKSLGLSEKVTADAPSLAKYLWDAVPEEWKSIICELTVEHSVELKRIGEDQYAQLREELKNYKMKLSKLISGGETKETEPETASSRPPQKKVKLVVTETPKQVVEENPTKVLEKEKEGNQEIVTVQEVPGGKLKELEEKITKFLKKMEEELMMDETLSEGMQATKDLLEYTKGLQANADRKPRGNAWDRPLKIRDEDRKAYAVKAVEKLTPVAKSIIDQIPVEVEFEESKRMASALIAMATPRIPSFKPKGSGKVQSLMVRNVSQGQYGALRANLKEIGLETRKIHGMVYRGNNLQMLVDEEYAPTVRELMGRNPRFSFPTQEQYWDSTWKHLAKFYPLNRIRAIRLKQDESLLNACLGHEIKSQAVKIMEEVDQMWERFVKAATPANQTDEDGFKLVSKKTTIDPDRMDYDLNRPKRRKDEEEEETPTGPTQTN